MAQSWGTGIGSEAALASSALRASTGSGGSSGSSSSWGSSYTNGTKASQISSMQAAQATASAQQAWEKAAEYNRQEAEAQRAWQEKMANTQYQRAVADLKAAGINPILAASHGISAASIGSGATASIAPASTFMGSSFADTNSASGSESNESSWNKSESGLATALKSYGALIQGYTDALNAAKEVDEATAAVKASAEAKSPEEWEKKMREDLLKQSDKNNIYTPFYIPGLSGVLAY
ncbi:minor capsid protein [Capybara microvirus Cap1_SP_162]|nr:minor capsid protein [Capybara microvirus Cap1_SP_162]